MMEAVPGEIAAEDVVDALYTERNALAQLCGKLAMLLGYDVRWGTDPFDPDWPVLFVQLPTGQVSWHIAPGHRVLEAPSDGRWDGSPDGAKALRIALLAGRKIGELELLAAGETPVIAGRC